MTIFTFEKLYRAYKECLKNKRNTANALKFEMKREKNLVSLLSDLQTGEYEISRHICFIVTEPSPREIFDPTISSDILAERIKQTPLIPLVRGKAESPPLTRGGLGGVLSLPDFDSIISYLKSTLGPNDVLITMGAGEQYKIGESLLV